MEHDSIRQLRSFLDERGKTLEQISILRSTLGSFRDDPTSSLPRQSAEDSSVDVTDTTVGAYYQRLLQALQTMQGQIEQRVRPAAQLVIQNQVDQLRYEADEKKAALRDCLSQLDQSLLQCLAGLDEYQRRRADLDRLNKNLARLGVSPEPIPEEFSVRNLSETISTRMMKLDRG